MNDEQHPDGISTIKAATPMLRRWHQPGGGCEPARSRGGPFPAPRRRGRWGRCFVRSPGRVPSSSRRGERRPPPAVLERFRRQLEFGGDVVAADGERMVARFAGRAGVFRYRTVELVSFRPGSVTFEHLHGPFKDCHERFRVEPNAGGRSAVTHEGTFVMRMGLFGWLVGVMVVRPIFERHVATHMAQHLRGPDAPIAAAYSAPGVVP